MLRSIKGTDQEEENCRSLHPIIPFSNSFFDFPLLFEYLPIILIILYVRSIECLARLDAGRGNSVDVDLTYSTESTRVGKNWGTKTIEQRRLTDDTYSINSLQSASLDVDVDDAIIMISGHCMKLHYYSIWAIWGIRDLISHHIILA